VIIVLLTVALGMFDTL